jgi:hypothetical protein
VGSMKKIIVLVCALCFVPVAPAFGADAICGPMATNAEKPLNGYLTYYRSVAASKPDESVYVQAEKDFLVSSTWLKSQFDNPKLFQNDCDPKIIHRSDLLAFLSANLEFRHDPSLIHAVTLIAQTDLVLGAQAWITADTSLGKPLYRFLLRGARDARTARNLPANAKLTAALASYP